MIEFIGNWEDPLVERSREFQGLKSIGIQERRSKFTYRIKKNPILIYASFFLSQRRIEDLLFGQLVSDELGPTETRISMPGQSIHSY